MKEGFEMLGRMVEAIFNSDYALYFLVLTIITILFANILRMLLSKIPMFQGGGDQTLNSYGNVTAWCIAFLAVISIGWRTKDVGVRGIVQGLAGPYGWLMVFVLAMVAGTGVYRGLEGHRKEVRMAFGLGVGMIIYTWMMGNILGGGYGWMWAIIVAAIAGSGVGLLTHLGRDA